MTGNVESGPVHPRFAVSKPQLASGSRPQRALEASGQPPSARWPQAPGSGRATEQRGVGKPGRGSDTAPMAHAPRGGLELRVCLLSVFAALRSHHWQGAGDGGESADNLKEAEAETVGKPGPTRVVRVSGIDASESEPEAQPGQSAIQIPPHHHFSGSGP